MAHIPGHVGDPDDLGTYGDDGKKGDVVNWNTKTTPVPFGYQMERYGSFPVQTNTPKQVPYNEASTHLNELRGKGGDEYTDFVSQLKRYTGSKFTSTSGEELAWKTVLDDAEASKVNVFELLARGSASGTTGGSGKYTGPVSSTTLMNEMDLKSTANAVASTVLGRGITDEEFQKVLKQVRTAERANPTISTPGVGSSVTQSGITAEGRQDIIREALMKGPEAEDYSKATTMMSIFNKALESRPEGA